MEIKQIAVIHTGFKEKFGIPRQGGLVKDAQGVIEFLPQFRSKEALRGLEGYSHIWVLWGFSASPKEHWAATVTPPRLGGRKRMGVFATRSPFRPNPIGMSAVKLEEIISDGKKGYLLRVSGVDMLDKTPVYDIKPYLPYADSYPDAAAGFAKEVFAHHLHVVCPNELSEKLPIQIRQTVAALLEQDPRTAFIDDETRIWGLTYESYNIRFTVCGETLTVCEITKIQS